MKSEENTVYIQIHVHRFIIIYNLVYRVILDCILTFTGCSLWLTHGLAGCVQQQHTAKQLNSSVEGHLAALQYRDLNLLFTYNKGQCPASVRCLGEEGIDIEGYDIVQEFDNIAFVFCVAQQPLLGNTEKCVSE